MNLLLYLRLIQKAILLPSYQILTHNDESSVSYTKTVPPPHKARILKLLSQPMCNTAPPKSVNLISSSSCSSKATETAARDKRKSWSVFHTLMYKYFLHNTERKPSCAQLSQISRNRSPERNGFYTY